MSEEQKEVLVHGDGEGLHQEVFIGSHRLAADEPPESGGDDRGPDPYDLLLASLGACTSMTITMHAQSEGLPLRSVTTRLQHSNVHADDRSEEHTSELQSRQYLVCRLLLEKKKTKNSARGTHE